jgi:hypothetical protein
MAELNNAASAGVIPFDTIVYASAGSNYRSVLSLVQYKIYDTPDPAFITPRINISPFANLGTAPWPFPNTSVPLNGHICIPRGRGPFPLIVFAHGNHNPFENSTPGYLYLCQLLASHGVIAATIDVNFLNGGNFGENDGRAIVHLSTSNSSARGTARALFVWLLTPPDRAARHCAAFFERTSKPNHCLDERKVSGRTLRVNVCNRATGGRTRVIERHA